MPPAAAASRKAPPASAQATCDTGARARCPTASRSSSRSCGPPAAPRSPRPSSASRSAWPRVRPVSARAWLRPEPGQGPGRSPHGTAGTRRRGLPRATGEPHAIAHTALPRRQSHRNECPVHAGTDRGSPARRWRAALARPHLELLQDDGAVGGAIRAKVHRGQLRQPEAADRAGGRAGPDLLRIKGAHRLRHLARPACMRFARPHAVRRLSRMALSRSQHVLCGCGGSVLLPAGMHPAAFLASLRVSV